MSKLQELKASTQKIPGFLGGDLPETERDAFEEGHDADLPTNNNAAGSHTATPTLGTTASDTKPIDASANHEANLEKGQAATIEKADEVNADPDIVDWDGPDDPANPQNWSPAAKWGNIAVLSAITFLVPLGSSFFAPGVPSVLKEFNENNETLATFVVSVYILGFAVGPLIFAPLSEIYGRLPLYHACNLGFIAFSVGCAVSTNMSMLIVFRFMQGVFGVAPVTIGGGTIADLMPPEQRGFAMSIWSSGPLLGPVISPVAGGFLSAAEGWRWIFWVIVIAVAVTAILGLIFMRETYAPVLLEKKTKRLRKETGNPKLRSKLKVDLSPKDLFIRAVVRPTKLLLFSPICTMMSIYMAVVYGVLYLLFTTFTFVFEDTYGFSESTVGLVYIAMGVGMLLGLGLLGATSDRLMKHLASKTPEGTIKPEFRLPPLMYLSPLIPGGMFIYGWTAQYQIHWIVPLIGTLFVGVGMIAVFLCISTYLVDAYNRYAASAMAANTVLRSIFGALFPLFGLNMYNTLGLGWGNSLLAFVSLAICPIPFLFYWYGERVRTNPRFQIKF